MGVSSRVARLGISWGPDVERYNQQTLLKRKESEGKANWERGNGRECQKTKTEQGESEQSSIKWRKQAGTNHSEDQAGSPADMWREFISQS